MYAILETVLFRIAAGEDWDDRHGDLIETYAGDLRAVGRAEARRRYHRHLRSCVASSLRCRSGTFLQDKALPVTAALMIALTGYGCLVRATADTWWIKSGFERNPGYFVSENDAGYPVCEPMKSSAPARRAVVVPKSARITKVYCGTPGRPLPLSDDNYTRGRVLTAPISFQVVWEE